jgi:predicted type IV restriction endonuclease
MSSKEQAAASIRATLDQLKQLVSGQKPPKLSESDTKANFIDKYIEALGYHGLADVTREYYVKNSQEFVDYVLRANDEPILAVEAKPLQADLTDKAAAQLIQYCAVEGIEWCVLTNGWELRLYNQYLKGALEAKLILKLDLLAYNSDDEFDAIFEQLWLLSKESMTTPSGIRTWMEHQQLDKAMRSLVLDPTSGVVKYIRRAISERNVQVSSEAVAQWFRTQLTAPVTPLLPTRSVKEPRRPTFDVAPATTPHDTVYWIVPAADRKDLGMTAGDVIRAWLGQGMWGMFESTPGRKRFKAGDMICFYAKKTGVIAAAEIVGAADQPLRPSESPTVDKDGRPFYRVPLRSIRWMGQPVEVDEGLRRQLDAFQGRPPSAPWGWFIQSTNKLSPHDFELLAKNCEQAVS